MKVKRFVPVMAESHIYDGTIGYVEARTFNKIEAERDKLKEVNAELLAALEAWEKAIPKMDEFGSVAPDSLRGKALAAIAKARGQA
ncbi:MAG: hypothetical protein WC236_09720 [Gallionellaceae bacterium]